MAPGGNLVDFEEKVFLGNSAIKILPLGVGTWQWGDRMMWNYSKSYTSSDVEEAFQVSWDAGIRFFDTAEIYGSGVSERLLGRFLKNVSEKAVVATKFMPLPWRLSRSAMKHALKDSLERLGMEQVDLYQIHWPMPPVSTEARMESLADLLEAGLIKTVGVSNFNVMQTKRAYLALKKRNVPLVSNQVEYSLTNRGIERSGLVNLCKDLGVSIIAYSPLAKGALTGKYDAEHLPPGTRGRTYNQAFFKKAQPLINLLREIGATHEAKTPAQVALNWAICKNTIVIPGAKTAQQARDNLGALGWRLSADEVSALDELSSNINA
jgi:aryl-alcohol dehydrogenase-like predicted oxidoreductase